MSVCEVCGAPVVRATTGRPRRYCSDRCRAQAKRDRQAFQIAAEPLHDPVDAEALRSFTAEAVAAALVGVEPASPVDQLTRAVGETENLAAHYKRLAQQTPRNLAWRANDMADHLRSGLDRLFPREDRA